MKEGTKEPGPGPDGRRRFLRDAMRGSLPLLLGLAEPTPPQSDPQSKPAPPPESPLPLPASEREPVERRQREFVRDNPGLTRYRDG